MGFWSVLMPARVDLIAVITKGLSGKLRTFGVQLAQSRAICRRPWAAGATWDA